MDNLGYGPRNAILAGMGYLTYADYLASPLWAGIRAQVMSGAPACALCRKPAQAVHHDSYTPGNLSGESADGLHPICHGCHRRIEFTKNGVKLGMRRVRGKFISGKRYFAKLRRSAHKARAKKGRKK